jgi:hypothetical protein
MNELAKSLAELINTINSGANGLGGAMKTHAPELWRARLRLLRGSDCGCE